MGIASQNIIWLCLIVVVSRVDYQKSIVTLMMNFN